MVKKILLVVLLIIIFNDLYLHDVKTESLEQRVTECEKQLEEKPKVVFVTTIVTATPTPTLPVSPILYTSTPTPSPEPTPEPTCTPTVTPRLVTGLSHSFKPYTDYRCYNIKASRNYKLQQLAVTDIYGLRVVKDSAEEERWCVALGTAWAGAHQDSIGNCVDIYMENGAVLKCVLADVKRTEDTVNRENRYGATNNDLVEFIVDTPKLVNEAKIRGNISFAADIFYGEPIGVVVRDDVYIPGLN